MHTRLLIFLILLLLVSSGCAVNPVSGQQELVLLSEQDEIAMGRTSHQQVLKQYGVYDNKELQRYVQDIGDRLAEKSHRNNLVYRFTVLDSKDVNAFALPGGYIYITRGLMAYLNSEAELAAVLGHEIGHVTARHAVRQYSATQMANIGATLGAILIPGMNHSVTNQLVQAFGTALLRGYGREHELEADRLGAEYLARTDYSPQSMLDVIRVLKNQESFETQLAKTEGREPRVYHGLFSTHPDNDTRLQEVIAHADGLKSSTSSNYTGRDQFLLLVDNMTYGDSPQNGIVRGHSFFHSDLGFTISFPQGWNVENLPDRLLLIAPNGDALMQLSMEDLNKRIPPRQFMVDRLGLNNLSNERSEIIHGLDAYTGISVVNTTNGRRPARFNVIYFNNQAYIFAGMTKNPKALDQFDPLFLETAASFHSLTPDEQLLAMPLRLKTVQVDESTHFKLLADQSPLEHFAEQQLRLLNGKYPTGEPNPGELIKIVQ
jgi:predicted Zn-dependent protease